jgi:UDP-N-acetylmuramyl pentapeptide synthase
VLNILDVIEAISGSRPDDSGQVISEAAIDSRQVLPGGLFIALPGERVDGHEYITDAFRRKANFALVQKDMSGSFNQIDLRNKKVPEVLPEPPYCILVPDSRCSSEDSQILAQETEYPYRGDHGICWKINYKGTCCRSPFPPVLYPEEQRQPE